MILDFGQASPIGGRSAAEVSKDRSSSSAKAFIQAALLFPEDEEERIMCFEMALEELLKVLPFDFSNKSECLLIHDCLGGGIACRRSARDVQISQRIQDCH